MVYGWWINLADYYIGDWRPTLIGVRSMITGLRAFHVVLAASNASKCAMDQIHELGSRNPWSVLKYWFFSCRRSIYRGHTGLWQRGWPEIRTATHGTNIIIRCGNPYSGPCMVIKHPLDIQKHTPHGWFWLLIHPEMGVVHCQIADGH